MHLLLPLIDSAYPCHYAIENHIFGRASIILLLLLLLLLLLFWFGFDIKCNNFCLFVSNISNMRKSFSSDIQTLRSGLKKRDPAEFF